jgi:hypothetical protein
MAHRHAHVRAVLLFFLLGLLGAAAAAQASPAGRSGIRPFIAGEEPATLEKPADQGTPVGREVALAIKGTELFELKAEGLPAGLEVKKVSSAEWEVTGAPTTIAAAATVTLTAENPKHGAPAVTKFSWTIGGIELPPDEKSIIAAPVKIPVTGVELKTLTASTLPPGLELKNLGSETSWEITGAAHTGLTQIELKGQNAKGEPLPPVEFTFGAVGANNPGPQKGSVGVPLEVAIHGVELAKLTAAKPLPGGLKLEDQAASEFEWRIVGTPTAAGVAEIELEVEDAGKQTQLLKFTLTIAEAETEAPPAPAPPTATGRLAISPAAAFAAAKSTCSGVAWSPAGVTTQWLLDGAPISGATATTYTAPRIDDGHVLSCSQTATGADGAVARQTSAGVTVHEQPAQPAWPIGPASEHCSSAVCMEDGNSAQTPVTRSYQQGGSWLQASQVRCVSAPWTSIAGSSSLASVAGFAEAHSVTVTLQRITPAGVVTVAAAQLATLGAGADALDGTPAGSPFAGQIVTGYGTEAFAPAELWTRLHPGALGRPDRFAAGQGYLAYQLAAGPGVKRSFQLVYNLAPADLGAKLRCVVAAADGPVASPTVATVGSPEYAVAKSSSCGPRRLAHVGGPQPAAVLIGSRRCLTAQAGLAEIGGSSADVSSVAGRSAIALECELAAGCSGRLTLSSHSHALAAVTVSVHRNGRRLVSLALNAVGRRLLRRAGSGGLAVTLSLAGHGTTRRLLAATLFSVT